jgi:hypothetical protein
MFPPIQPTGIRYFSHKKNAALPSGIKRLFYLSWEDALWDLIDHVFTGKATILVPEFFCDDVVGNMKAHGNTVHFYPVGKDLQTQPSQFIDCLNRYSPDIVIIFHAVGITNTLISHYNSWKDSIQKHTVILEDCVHRIIRPNDISLLQKRHVLIDSLRKVMPLQGSFIYGSPRFLTYDPPRMYVGLRYRIMVFFFFLLYQAALLTKQNSLAEWAMIQGYTIIGDHTAGVGGDIIFRTLFRHIHIQRIREIKKRQTELYIAKLHAIIRDSSGFFSIPFTESDKEELRGFPIGIRRGFRSQCIALLRKSHFIARLELVGSPWTQKYGIIYLPLGPHVSKKEQDMIIKTVLQAVRRLSP